MSRLRFKPETAARRVDYVVREIPHADAAAFIRREHYAKGCANTSTEAFGLFRGQALVGAALWMPPTRVCAESVDREQWRKVISLSRVALLPEEPTNAESLFIGAMLRSLNKAGRWVAAVTSADESQGHEGIIYKATNWRYLGRTKPEPRWLDANGKQVSRRATKSRKAKDMTALGCTMVGKFSKHKYVYRFKRVNQRLTTP